MKEVIMLILTLIAVSFSLRLKTEDFQIGIFC